MEIKLEQNALNHSKISGLLFKMKSVNVFDFIAVIYPVTFFPDRNILLPGISTLIFPSTYPLCLGTLTHQRDPPSSTRDPRMKIRVNLHLLEIGTREVYKK